MINGEEIRLIANPMHDILAILKLAIIVGVVHLCIGWLVSAYNYVINKRAYIALTDPIMKILLLTGGTYLIFTWGFDINSWLSPPYPILYAFLPALGIIFGKPLGKIVFKISYLQEESVGKLLGESSVEVGETYLSILSNVSSYTRILALAMAHIGLMTIVSTIAELLPSIKWLVVIGGNAFVIILEGLLASIHSLRLQFYEFFGKFFLADGVAYESDEIKNEFSLVEFVKV